MSANLREAERWYRQGVRDGKTARKNANNEDFEVSCFLYQQGAEKLLKAFLYLQGERMVMGHATLDLAKRCAAHEAGFEKTLDACRELDVFYVPTRYPNGIPGGSPFEYFVQKHADRAARAYRTILETTQRSFPNTDLP